MHRCLEVEEILSLIFENVDDNENRPLRWPGKSLRSGTLAALSRTCKAFSEPALDILWRSHVSLEPLVRCLPQDAWTMIRRDLSESRLLVRIIRDLLPEDFGRIHYYSHRIKKLGFGSSMISGWDTGTSDPATLHMLWSCKPRPGPLLPGLLELNIQVTSFQDFALYPRLIVGPVLKNITINWCGNMIQGFLGTRSVAANMASTIQPALSAITSFKIMYSDAYLSDSGIDFGVEPEVMLLYRNFCSLQYFAVRATYITSSVLAHLASLPDLKKLTICIHADELAKFNEAIPLDRVVFSGLVELFIETESLTDVQRLLNLPGFSKLQILKVAQTDAHDIWEVEPFLAVLTRHTQLERIELFEPDFSGLPLPGLSQITERTLTPLLSLPNITRLEIRLGGTVSLSDDFLGRMAEAWPRLEVVDLHERTMGAPPKTTMRGIFTLTTSCSNLKRLSLRFNALNDILEDLPPLVDAIPCGTLEFLDVCTSPVETGDELVLLIEVMFPNLNQLHCGWFYTNMFGQPINPVPELPRDEMNSYEWWNGITKTWDIRRRAWLYGESA